jgi:hypothetical protein
MAPRRPRFSSFIEPPRHWTGWLHISASLAGIAFAFAALFERGSDAWVTVLVIWVCLTWLALWVLLYVQEVSHRASSLRQERRNRLAFEALERRYARDARYARATPNLHNAFHKLRDATVVRMLNPSNSEAFLSEVQRSATDFAMAFSTITGATCRVCVKQVQQRTPRLSHVHKEPLDLRQIAVFDLCRSTDITALQNVPSPADWVDDNSDFEELFVGSTSCFFANDLRELAHRGQYKNSHWTADTLQKQTYEYLSTIVWPIRRAFRDPSAARELHAISSLHDLLGFLCVDSKKPDIFDRSTDYEIGAAYADTLYMVLKPWAEERSATPTL